MSMLINVVVSWLEYHTFRYCCMTKDEHDIRGIIHNDFGKATTGCGIDRERFCDCIIALCAGMFAQTIQLAS